MRIFTTVFLSAIFGLVAAAPSEIVKFTFNLHGISYGSNSPFNS